MAKETPEITPPVAPQETKKEGEDTTSTAPVEEKTPEIDHAAELEKAKKQLGQAEHTIVETKKENKELKENQLSKEEIQEQVTTQVNEQVNAIRQDSVKDTTTLILDGLTDNPDERALIEHHYENTIVKTGYSKEAIKHDLENAKWQANRKTITKTVEDLEDKVASDSAITNSGGGSSPVKTRPESKVTLSAAEEESLGRMNKNRKANGNPELTPQEFRAKVAGQGGSVVSSSSVA